MSDDPSSLCPSCEILVLEDDSLLRRQLAALLRRLGATITEASRLAEATAATQNNVSAAVRRIGVTCDFMRYRLEQDPVTNGPKD